MWLDDQFKLQRILVAGDNTEVVQRLKRLRRSPEASSIEAGPWGSRLDMALIDARTSRVLFTVLLFALGLGFLYVARGHADRFPVCDFLCLSVDPAVSRLEKWLRGRGRAIARDLPAAAGGPWSCSSFSWDRGSRTRQQRFGQSLPELLEPGQFRSQIAERDRARAGLERTTQEQLAIPSARTTDDIKKYAERFGLRVADVAKEAWLLFSSCRFWRFSF